MEVFLIHLNYALGTLQRALFGGTAYIGKLKIVFMLECLHAKVGLVNTEVH